MALSFPDQLKKAIAGGLPGTEIQWLMSSSDRNVPGFQRIAGSDAKIAAVVILLYPFNDVIYTVFIQRPDYDGVHGGQISFPGGKAEEGDADIIATALRESREEIGIDPSAINITGVMTPLFIPVSNTLVTPVTGYLSSRPVFNTDPSEVKFLIEAPVYAFIDTSVIKTVPMDIRHEPINVRYFDYNSNVIWGATAMMFNELLTLIRRDGISLRV